MRTAFQSLLRSQRPKPERAMWILLIAAGGVFGAMAYWRTGAPRSALAQAVAQTALLYGSLELFTELAPDRPDRLRVGLVVAAVLATIGDRSALFASVYLLLLVRLLIGASGAAPTISELVGMSIYSAALFTVEQFSYPLLFAVALIVDLRYRKGEWRNLPFIAANLLISLLWLRNPFGLAQQNAHPVAVVSIWAIALLYLLRLSILKSVLSYNDVRTTLISPRRVKAAGILLLLSLLIQSIGHGQLWSYLHYWTVLLSIALPYVRDIAKLFGRDSDAFL